MLIAHKVMDKFQKRWNGYELSEVKIKYFEMKKEGKKTFTLYPGDDVHHTHAQENCYV